MVSSVERMVTPLVPLLSHSLEEQFNIFRVMHHGTHEKQLSNVFAWLLGPDETHGLGDFFQRIFVELVNERIGAAPELPKAGYRVTQEVNAGKEGEVRDIADVVLTATDASLVIENFETSDGHGHDYDSYLALGAVDGRRSVVVLLCVRAEPHRQTDGWEKAVVVTYAELLTRLRDHVSSDVRWRRSHPQQNFFLSELITHFVEVPGAVNHQDQIQFLKAMCETGESDRYAQRPNDAAAEEFASALAGHARHQFEGGRGALGAIKRSLRDYCRVVVAPQLGARIPESGVPAVETKFQGMYEWCVSLYWPTDTTPIHLVFGPTAGANIRKLAELPMNPDYGRIFMQSGDGAERKIVQTSVTLLEVLDGTLTGDGRLSEEIVAFLEA